ncbi:MAG: dihydroxyacetone kinase family protein [Propionibacteriaceae bacterium]|jgi:dihydroxyacetone kinase|nr:dihydroxyacetone kinase family protein [Propionibacteriaceae bacterium]
MALLENDPAAFAADALRGYVAANANRAAAVPGGAVRATACPEGQVAVVMGGGSGHFPAFAGWLGPGLVHGAVCGNIFASPSAAQVASVVRAADNGGGVLLLPINYAGDILNFGEAADTLRAEGMDIRMVAVTDDIASGSSEEHLKRRGIAGSFLVAKVVCAAAAEGQSLADIEQLALAANLATRSFGVALTGCTLPGADAPLFTVPAGKMAVGLGIHGEPGIDEAPLGTAEGAADLLVDGLFGERLPVDGQQVAVLVNGLGNTSPDELHLVFTRVKERLEAAGMVLVAPLVADLVTSLDMAGLSLSIMYLTDEFERLWLAPAECAYFSRGSVGEQALRKVSVAAVAGDEEAAPEASADSQALAARLADHLVAVAELLAVQEAALGAIDSVAGDGDHGAGMRRGSAGAAAAAQAAAAAGAGAGTLLKRAGEAWANDAGGASGALWGGGMAAAGGVLGDEDALDIAVVVSAVQAYRDAITSRGGAQVGDKTMVDAIIPFVAALEREVAVGVELASAWQAAAQESSTAAAATADIVARLGRARTHGEHSLGTPDAGATSFAMIMSLLGERV